MQNEKRYSNGEHVSQIKYFFLLKNVEIFHGNRKHSLRIFNVLLSIAYDFTFDG